MEETTRILGVDDSLTIRKALELVLRPAGYQLELAASGAEAVEKARDFRPAVLLLDFILPDMRGTEVCKRLASDPETAGIPVVLISAKGAEIRQAYQDVGNVVSYITKPFTPEDVTGVVADVLARSREGGLIRTETPVGEVAAVEMAAAVEAAQVSVAPVAEPAPLGIVGPPIRVEAPQPAPPAEVWEEAEEEQSAAEVEAPAPAADAGRREALEMMFESLRAGLEGVYVEEVDTPAGAAADEAKSYTDLVLQLTRQLGETLSQARSGLRFNLSSDGSVRSLDDSLLDAYRRLCRLLFRAVAAGAVQQDSKTVPARVLVACRRDGEVLETLGAAARSSDWHGFTVCERFRQLPILTRLFGPTHLVVELCRSGALVDQLRAMKKMPEWKRLRVIGVARGRTTLEPDLISDLGIETVLEDGPELLAGLRNAILPQAGPGAESGTPNEGRAAVL